MNLITATLRRMGLAVLTALLVISSFAVFAPSAAAAEYTIKMGTDRGMLAFEPAKLTVKVGDTVKFVNNRVPPHNVVFDSSKSANKAVAVKATHKQLMMSPGQSFEVSFADAEPGEYPFYCEPHRGAGMAGKIIVE
ncbi:MAG: plastocyanin [Calothrix sp. MO_192.B10]|nr:plastocyanin [Calothrix sp. MO_192.B10]